MSKRPKSRWETNFVTTAFPRIKPGDFPVGSVQSRAAARAMVAAYAEKQRDEEEAELAKLTPVERACVQAINEDIDKLPVRIFMIRLHLLARERSVAYEISLPSVTPDEIRHNRAVFKEIDRMTDGEASSIQSSDSVEWNRLKIMAEEKLRAKK